MSTTITVQRGQTLSSIAAKYGTTVDALAKANNLSDPNRIVAGAKLVIPDRFESGGRTQSSGAKSGGDNFDAKTSGAGGSAGTVKSNTGRQFPTSADGTPMFRQGDPEWGGRVLGRNYTVAQAGCAMTATAMAISKISGKTVTPGELDSYLDKHGGYAGDGIYWDKAAQMVGLHAGPAGWNLDTLNKQVDAGRPVVVGVDYKPGSGGGANGTDHYVTITGHARENGKSVYLANDPATGKQFKFTQQGNQLVSDYHASNGNPYRTTGVLMTFSGGPARPTGPGRTGGSTSAGGTSSTGGTSSAGGTSSTGSASAPAGLTAPKQDLKVGGRGAAVEELQRDLVKLGFMSQSDMNTGPGIYGPHTKAAVAKLQERYGISGNGGENYGPQTRAALEKALDGKGSGSTGGTSTGGTTGGTTSTGSLTNEPNHQFTYKQLQPTIDQYAKKYGVDPKILAGIVDQESSFKNFIVHRDGHGHGLIGLDDGGLLPDFERWSGMKVGRGANAKSIPPEKQIEYLAKTMGELTKKYHGNQYMAAREWHTGAGGVNSREGALYESLVKQRERELGLI